jgi:hypothetical protein
LESTGADPLLAEAVPDTRAEVNGDWKSSGERTEAHEAISPTELKKLTGAIRDVPATWFVGSSFSPWADPWPGQSIGVNYPIALGTRRTKALFDPGETLPLTVVIDRRRMIRDRIQGLLLPQEFEDKVKPLLR